MDHRVEMVDGSRAQSFRELLRIKAPQVGSLQATKRLPGEIARQQMMPGVPLVIGNGSRLGTRRGKTCEPVLEVGSKSLAMSWDWSTVLDGPLCIRKPSFDVGLGPTIHVAIAPVLQLQAG